MMKLIKEAERNKIIVDEYDFKGQYLGIYFKTTNAPPGIYLDKHLSLYSAKTRCILAEEIGHHFTTSGNSIHQHINYGKIIKVGKIEKAALRWAAHFLIPDEELFRKLQGKPSIYELANLFSVTQEFMQFRKELFEVEEYGLRHGTLRQRLNTKRTTRQLAGSFSTF